MDCKCCGNWFGSASDSEICSICERAIRRVGKYLFTIDPIRAAGGCRCGECRFGRKPHAEDMQDGYVYCQEQSKYMSADDFCSGGDPREARDDG